MKILVINGHKHYWYSEGRLNQTLFDETISILSPSNEIKSTIVENGYEVKDEIDKFLWADVIIFQTPVNWFSMPWILKKYVDEVYQHGIFYQGSEQYGRGGMLNGKKYMYSLTMNTPMSEFEKSGGFFDGRCIDDVIISMHKLQEYSGLEKIPTFSVNDVVKNPDIEAFKTALKSHLKKYI